MSSVEKNKLQRFGQSQARCGVELIARLNYSHKSTQDTPPVAGTCADLIPGSFYGGDVSARSLAWYEARRRRRRAGGHDNTTTQATQLEKDTTVPSNFLKAALSNHPIYQIKF